MMSGTGKQDKDQTSYPTSSGTGRTGLRENMDSNGKLPEEMLRLIFQKIEHFESQLNCRLICKYWKSTFDSSTIMKELTVKVNDWRLFNNSTIVDKVKAVCFNAPFKVTKAESKNKWPRFCNKIGSRVQKIKFDFVYDDNDSQQAQLINSFVSSCVGLKELHINEQILECLQLKKYENIQTLVFTTFEKPGAMAKALVCFPNLVKLDARYSYIFFVTFTVLEYAKTSVLLKEFIFGYPTGQERLNPGEWLKFLLTCGNLGIILRIKNDNLPVGLDSTALFKYVETDEAPVNEVTCQIFQRTEIKFWEDNPLTTDRIGYCRNINDLSLVFFSRPAIYGELQFFPNLQKLEKLVLKSGILYNNNPDNINFATHMFEFRFPSLTSLEIVGDVFGRAFNEVLPLFSTCFPNLKRLFLRNLRIVPSSIFVHLSKLELLEKMQITRAVAIHLHLNHECEWTDDKFILPCESQARQDPDRLIPAITAFKNLTKLAISGCVNLTDVCVLQGIALSKTLKEVSISGFNSEYPSQLTEASVAALEGSELHRGDFTWKA